MSDQPSRAAMHDANRRYWDALSPDWEAMRDQDARWQRSHQEPELGLPAPLLSALQQHVAPLKGKRAAVLASGDNHAVFALAGLGGQVTSVDISEGQLAVAARRAHRLGLAIRFVAADITHMPQVESGHFDLVCSTNGALVWLADLKAFFAEAARILVPGGHLLMYDVHPFQRPWANEPARIVMEKPYFEHGPFAEDVPPDEVDPARLAPGAQTYEFHWTMSHILNALSGAGLRFVQMQETASDYPQAWVTASYSEAVDEGLLDWQINPRAGLPFWLTIVAQK